MVIVNAFGLLGFTQTPQPVPKIPWFDSAALAPVTFAYEASYIICGSGVICQPAPKLAPEVHPRRHHADPGVDFHSHNGGGHRRGGAAPCWW
jgi:hypothetical protein